MPWAPHALHARLSRLEKMLLGGSSKELKSLAKLERSAARTSLSPEATASRADSETEDALMALEDMGGSYSFRVMDALLTSSCRRQECPNQDTSRTTREHPKTRLSPAAEYEGYDSLPDRSLALRYTSSRTGNRGVRGK